MPNNIYRFRRLKWGAPKRLNAVPGSMRPPAFGWDTLAIVAGVVVIGALVHFLI